MKQNNIALKWKLWRVAVLLLCFTLAFSTTFQAFAQSPSGSDGSGASQGANRVYFPYIFQTSQVNLSDRVKNLQVLATSIAPYERFEAHFDVVTSASNYSLPYDPNPPSGLTGRDGVTVDVLFSRDHWATAYTQPAFYDQPYRQEAVNGKNHFIPNGAPRWAVRFAPQQSGTWEYRISVKDNSGVSYAPAMGNPGLSFQVSGQSSNPYVRRGFLRVSPTDSRYFQFDNGEPFIGVGYNDGFDNIQSVEQKMQSYEQNKIDFMRVWMSGSGINGSQWTSWASNFLSQEGYLPGTNFDTQNTYNGGDVSLRLDNNNPCFYTDFWQGGVPAEPNTTYKVWARVKVSDVSGSGDYGFVIKQGDWLDKSCADSGTGTRITQPVNGSTDWVEVSGQYTTGSDQSWLNYLYLARENASGGQVYIDEVRVWKADDPNQVNLLRQPYANAHLHFDPMNAAAWDAYIQSAEQHGVYLKLVIDEKNEWIRDHLGADGKMTADGSNDNFYAAPGTKVRWLEQAWWRYIIARWGYSTAIHSFEFVNEGDPYNGHHYEAANSMAKYFHENDPSRHMVTTSFWSDFPNAEFWSNSQYPDIDYVDLHAYIATGWGQTASLLPDSLIETNPAYTHSGNGSVRITASTGLDEPLNVKGSLVIRGKGEWIVRYWMKAEGFSANCPYSGSGGMQRVQWTLDGGTYNGGKQGVIPANQEGKDFICTSPGGTFDWSSFRSDQDLNGSQVPAQYRIILSDDQPHALGLRLQNSNGASGTAWIDDLQIVSPSGQVQPVIGQFDVTPLDEDTAWYNAAYAQVFGGASLVGARKPLVRGETGIDFVGNQDWNRDLLKDTQGIWLHNNVWGQINPGGMPDLFWWTAETLPASLYPNYLTFRNFMEGIPLSNGHYYGIQAQTSDASLRAWGQRDDSSGRMHLWVQNTQHTWKKVVNGDAIPALSGSLTIQNVPSGSYRVEWWNTYQVSNPVFKTETVSANGSLTLQLPSALSDDVAVKLQRLP